MPRFQHVELMCATNLGGWPTAGHPAEHLGWGARLLHFAPFGAAKTKIRFAC